MVSGLRRWLGIVSAFSALAGANPPALLSVDGRQSPAESAIPAVSPVGPRPAFFQSRFEEPRPVTFRSLPRAILRDQAFLWLRPFRPKGSDLPWAAAFFGTTAGLMFVDNNVAQGLAANPPGGGYDFSSTVGKIGMPLSGAAIGGTIYLLGRTYHNQHAQTTGVLSLRALADSALIVQVLKTLAQRPRPTHRGGVHTNHLADGEFFARGNAFPSGHAAGAFALATVIAERNRQRPWIPLAAYGLAGLVSSSRVTVRRHFPSDVFVGAVIGYLIGRRVVHDAEAQARSNARRVHFSPYVPSGGGAAMAFSWTF